MKKLLLAASLSLLIPVSALEGGGLDAFLNNVNIQARSDMNGFTTKVSAQFGVPEAQVKLVLNKVGNNPADAFMVFQLGQMSNRPTDDVMRVYQTGKDRGWGVMAQELGIRPGSPEFHALKRGDLHYGPNGAQAQDDMPGPGRGHGHGRGMGRGNPND